jgi:hypothetical protein
MGPKLVGGGYRLLSSLYGEASVFVWWARAVPHASNPLLTKAAWAPSGMNLAWVTTLPGPSLVLTPLTRVAGPAASFNLLVLLSPPLTAWTAYLLAHRVTRRVLPALVGGFFFGFSPAIMREVQQGHPNLTMLFLLPLGVYLIVRRLEGSLGPVSFVLSLAAVLVGQFSIFIETFATATVIGVLIGVTAWAFAPSTTRRRLLDVGKLAAISYAIVAVVISPFLYTAFAYPEVAKPRDFSGLALGLHSLGDVGRFVRPGPAMALGPGIGHHHPDVNFWYIGLPLLLLLAMFFFRGRQDWKVRTLALGFALCVILALGPSLPVSGHRIPLPWTLFAHLPLLGRARPGRLVAYAFLIASLSVAMWAAQARGRSRHPLLTWGLVCLVVVSILPKYWADIWTLNVRVPAFFTTADYRTSLCPGETVLTVNPSIYRPVYWQTQAHLFYRGVIWYPGFVPVDYQDPQFAERLATGKLRARDGPALLAFVSRHGVTAVLAEGVAQDVIDRLASTLGTTPQMVGDLTFMRLAPCPSG